MSAPISLPQARIPIAWVMVNGQRLPAEIDMEWMMTFMRMFERSGGTSGDDSFNEYITQFFDVTSTTPILQEAVRTVDDLRHELAITRSELQSIRGLIEDQAVQIAQARPTEDMRVRVEQIENRLQ